MPRIPTPAIPMPAIVMSMLAAAILLALARLSEPLAAQGTTASAAATAPPPDFSGVYYPVQQGRGGQGQSYIDSVAAASTSRIAGLRRCSLRHSLLCAAPRPLSLHCIIFPFSVHLPAVCSC